ncbi:MAG: AMP-binding protein, partial [Bryobacteraceae bacterium]
GIEATLGTFINTVPVRVQVNPDAGLIPWLRNLHALQAVRSPHEHAALSDIRQWSGIHGNQPLFETNVVFMNYPLNESLRFGSGLSVIEVEVYDRTDTPLTLQVTPGNSWEVELLYDAQRFDEAAMRRWLGHLTQLLGEFAANPERSLAQFPILTGAERRQIVEIFNNTKVDYDAARTFVTRFEEVAAAHSERIALRFGNRQVQYGELNRRANRLARAFRDSFGMGRGDLAAVRLARSDRMVESILAIWKCGAAYVPIEAHQPEERVRNILSEIRAKVVVTEGELDRIQADVSRQEDSNLNLRVHPDDLAYVIFTSGSTGKPKGAMIEHAGMLNHLLAKQEA